MRYSEGYTGKRLKMSRKYEIRVNRNQDGNNLVTCKKLRLELKWRDCIHRVEIFLINIPSTSLKKVDKV